MNHDIISTMSTGFTYVEKAYIPNVSNILVITEEVKLLIQQYFSSPVPQFTLVNNLRFDYPQTLNTYDEIHICCMDTSWAQIAFQLSHEFCHLMIGKPVVQTLRWFEEVLAELSSLFFLRKLHTSWKRKGILGHPEYSDSLMKYVNSRMTSADTSVLISDALKPDTTIWKNLIENPYMRSYNLCIAIHLLPVFEKNPSLWHIVPLIGDLPDISSFSEFFVCWKRKTPEEYHSLIQKVYDAFTAPGSTN